MENMNSPNLLVIGGTGFIGHHLLKKVTTLGWQTTSISLNYPAKDRFVEGVKYLNFDIVDKELLKKFIGGKYNFVVNLGGYINHQLFKEGGYRQIDTHFLALKNLVEILPRENLISFVQVGSSDEYGNNRAPQKEEQREKPISPYSFSKLACTHFLQMLHITENFPSVILRLFLTYGPCQNKNRFLPHIINGCLTRSSFPTSEGNQIRDFCFVDDTVSAIIKALTVSDINGEIFNVASGIPITIKEIIKRVREIVGSGYPKFGEIPYRSKENMSLYANISKAKQKLNWEPRIDLEKGLKETISWYKNRNV